MKHLFVISLVLLLCLPVLAQSTKASREVSALADELMKLRELGGKASDDVAEAGIIYKTSLRKLLEFQQNDVKAAVETLEKHTTYFTEHMISDRELAESERHLASAKAKIIDTEKKLAEADDLIAEARVDAQKARSLTHEQAMKEAKSIIAKNKRERRRDGHYEIMYIFFGVAVVHVLK